MHSVPPAVVRRRLSTIHRGALAWLVWLLSPCWMTAGVVGAQTIGTANATARFAVHPGTGVPGLASVGDAAEPQAHVFDLATPIWRIEVSDPVGGGASAFLDPTTLTGCQTQVRVLSPSHLVIEWRQCTSTVLVPGQSIDVTVDARFATDDALRLDIRVTTATPSHAVRVVEFPRLDIASRGRVLDQVMTWPFVSGWLLPSPMTNPVVRTVLTSARARMPGSVGMQWFSYYDTAEVDAAVLFFGTRDATGWFKEIFFERSKTHLPLRLAQYPAGVARDADYDAPYDFVLRVLRGDWYDAARYYRRWALTQPWTQAGPMRTNPGFSAPIKNARMFSANSFNGRTSADFAKFRYWPRDMEDLRDYFELDVLPNLTYRWYNGAPLGNAGDWLPIRSEFAAAGVQVRQGGDPHAPYFFNLFYNSRLASYSSSNVPGHIGLPVEPNGILDENGNRVFETPVTSDPALRLCPTPPFLRDYTRWIADRLRTRSGAQGIYLDFFTVDDARRCFDPAHGHPIGAGDHYTQAKLRLLDDLRRSQRALEPDYYVISEAPSEHYLGRVELTFAHNTLGPGIDPSIVSVAPLFEAVYNDFQITTVVAPPILVSEFGSMPKGETIFRRLYAVNVHLGHLPWTGALFDSEQFDESGPPHPGLNRIWQTIRSYMRVLRRDVVHDHVTLGERMREPTVSVPFVTPLPADVLLVLYRRDQPMVYTSVYRAAGHEGVGFLLINWTDQSDPFPSGSGGSANVVMQLDLGDYGLSAGRYRIVETTARGDVVIGERQFNANDQITFTVPERTLRFVRLVRV